MKIGAEHRAVGTRLTSLLGIAILLVTSCDCEQRTTAEQEARDLTRRLLSDGRDGFDPGSAPLGPFGVLGSFRYDLATEWGADRRKLQLLLLSLEDWDPIVRALAATALGVSRKDSAVEPLIESFERSLEAPMDEEEYAEYVKAKIKALDGVAKNGDGWLWLPLEDRLVLPYEQLLRQQCVWALGQIGDDRAVAVLVTATREFTQNVRREAVYALYRVGTVEARQALKAVATDKDFEDRVVAVEAAQLLTELEGRARAQTQTTP